MKISIVDFGAGNLYSIAKALSRYDGVDVRIEDDKNSLLTKSDLIVLPGVGAFSYANNFVSEIAGDLNQLVNDGFPMIGICLGMQLLFEESEEGDGTGVGVFSGLVTRLTANRIPQIGWNTLDVVSSEFRDSNGELMYFANSYACRPTDETVVSAWVEYESDRFPAIVRKNNVVCTQFHPEKSSTTGLGLLDQIVRMVIR